MTNIANGASQVTIVTSSVLYSVFANHHVNFVWVCNGMDVVLMAVGIA